MSILLLTFLVPAVVFGAIAGVFVDMFDRRWILISTNLARGGLFLLLVFFSDQLALIYVVTAIVATLTTFFAPAEAAMIPLVVKREQLMTANSLFILALQASFVVGFAVLGPLAQTVFGTELLIIIVAAAYGLAGLFCWILPPAPPSVASQASLASARSAVAATFAQLREGLGYIRDHHNIFWSLTYLTMVASLIGVLGVLGPDFAKSVLGLEEGDLVVVLLPLGAGLIGGIVVLNLVGKYLSRRRLIEGGMIALGDLAHHPRPRPGPASAAQRRRQHGPARGRRRGRLRGRRLLRLRGRARPDLAPGGAAGGRPRPRLRRPQHARQPGLVRAHHHRRSAGRLRQRCRRHRHVRASSSARSASSRSSSRIRASPARRGR